MILTSISDPDPISGFNSCLTCIALYMLYSFYRLILFLCRTLGSHLTNLLLIQEIHFLVVCLRKLFYLISPSNNDFFNLFLLSLLGSSFPPGCSFAIWAELWQVRRCCGWRRDTIWNSSAVTEHLSKRKTKWEVWTNDQVLTPWQNPGERVTIPKYSREITNDPSFSSVMFQEAIAWVTKCSRLPQ